MGPNAAHNTPLLRGALFCALLVQPSVQEWFSRVWTTTVSESGGRLGSSSLVPRFSLLLSHRIQFGEECFLLVLALHIVADVDGLLVTGPVGDFEAEFFVSLAGLDPLASALDGYLGQFDSVVGNSSLTVIRAADRLLGHRAPSVSP